MSEVAASLRAVGVTVIDSVRRRHGDRVASQLDGQIGGLRLRPRSTAAIFSEPRGWHAGEFSQGDAEGEFKLAVERHNQPILERLREAELIGPSAGVRCGKMAEALNKLSAGA